MDEKSLFKTIIDTSENGVVIYHAMRDGQHITDFQFDYANPKAELIMKAPAETLRQGTLKNQLPASNSWLIDIYAKVVETGEPFRSELHFDMEPVGNVWFSVVTAKLNDGIVVTFNDVTEAKLAREELIRNEKKFRQIFENVQDVFYQTDAQGIITEISPSIKLYSVYSREEIIGKPVTEFYYFTEDRERLAKELFEKGTVHDFEVRLKTKDNRLVYTSVNCHIMFDEHRNIIGTEGSMRDISDRKAKEEIMRESERKMTLFVSQAPTSIAMLDTNMRYLAVSQRWCDDYHFATTDFIGKNHYDVFPNVDETRKEMHRRCLNGAVEKKAEDLFIHQDGVARWIKWEIRPWYDSQGAIGGLLMFTEDITEQKKRQDEIRSLFKELQEINRQKDKLFSIIAHDLRGPFGTFTSLFDMIVSEYDSFSREELLKYFDELKISSKNVLQLLEDLLLWARNQLDKVTFEPQRLDLAVATEKVTGYLGAQAAGKGVKLINSVPQNLFVLADPNMLETVVRNLVSNAVKFSHRGGEVSVSAASRGELIEVSVKDHGTGIKPEDMHKLFDKSASYTTYGTSGEKGSGIGLDLCRDFIEKNGGTIRVESEYGKGSVFSFTLKASS